MSRCFPFPPPGYEKKAWPDDDANFLIKEKHKEKKHKKDKKDKEKKEKREKKDKERSGEKNREKKDKERSGEKNREKKDRKRKHKDKDKNKEKEEKDSEEKKVVGSSSHQNGEKLGPIRIQVDQTEQGRLLLELEKRVGNQNGAREIHSVDKSSVKQLGVKSSGKDSESSLGIVVEGNQKFKNNREENRNPNGQSLKVSAKNLENGFLGNILAKEQKIVEGAVCQENVSEKRKERKDKNKHKSSDGREDKHKDGDRERKSKSKDKKEKKEKMKEEKVKEVSTPVQSKIIENCNNDVDIQNDRGSYLFKGSSSNNGNLGKRKEPEMNGLVHGNGSPISKLPRPLSSSKVGQNGSRNDASNPGIRFPVEREAPIVKHKLDAQGSCSSSISEEGTRLDNKQSANNYAPESQGAMNNYRHKTSESLSTLQPPLGIGRNLEHCQTAMNFARKEQGMVANHKLNKKVLYSQPIAENGRKLQPSLPSTFSSAERQGAVSKPKLDHQQSRTNSLGLRKPDACSMRPSPVSADQLKETVMKPPHPDAKYLSEILSVPKVEWSDIDDQAWLFPREDHGGKKPKIDSTTFEESKQVWAEALQLESADVTALPYVIPF